MNKNSQIATIPLWSLLGRIIFEFALRPFFPLKTIDKYQGLKKAVKAAKEGKGLLLVFTHFSLRDAMEVNRCITYRNPLLRNRDSINPLAYYQHKPFLIAVGRFFHGKFYPIVNTSTLEKKGYEHLPRGKGLPEFAAAAADMLSRGGVVTLAVNASRKEKLELEDPQKPIGYFVAALLAKGVKNYGLLPVGFEIKNAKSYAKKEAGGMNIFKTYVMNIGSYYPIKELLKSHKIQNKPANLDPFIRQQMTKLVAKEYL
jgi:hypothetical protein